jgi:hypothetical protein
MAGMGHGIEQPSRLELARQRLRTAQLVACAGSAAAFVALLLAVKAAHPATVGAAVSPSSADDQVQTQQDDDSFGFGSGSFGGGGGGSPQVQTGGS